MDRQSMEYKRSKTPKRSAYKKSKDETKLEVKEPCESCRVFFDGFNEESKGSFPPFGNCAEYDVIRTVNLDYELGCTETRKHWEVFKSACERHFKEFNELAKNLEELGNQSQNEIMETYYTNTRNAKVLKYQRYSDGYELVAIGARPWDKGPPGRARNSEMM
ncbi:Hypothetical predicted protein, partial [Paramuricea clavata]